jgi:hypothetical protein
MPAQGIPFLLKAGKAGLDLIDDGWCMIDQNFGQISLDF